MKLNSPEGESYMAREAERRQAERWEPEDDDEEKCPECSGLGLKDDYEDCEECNGTGYLSTK
jgi:DnaJ-class molecular chaperone